MRIYRLNVGGAEGGLSGEVGRRLAEAADEEHLRRARAMRREEDAIRSLAGRWLVKEALKRLYGFREKEMRFGRDVCGKPMLIREDGEAEIVHFNISHSGTWVACAVDDQPIGIDIERHRLLDVDRTASFFATAERKQVLDASPDKRLNDFYDLWTLKESYLKAIGQGMLRPLDSFSLEREEGRYVCTDGGARSDRRFRLYDIGEGYSCAVCARHEDWAEFAEPWRL